MINKNDKFLPLGTVVLLNGATQCVMIIGYCAKVSNENNAPFYDYIGCLYPEGVFTSEQSLVFNHDKINKICFQGFYDDAAKKFEAKLKSAINNLN